jgi:hypothetical protein
MPRRRSARLTQEYLENRTRPSTFNGATVSDLIAEINAANAGGTVPPEDNRATRFLFGHACG